MTTNAKRKMSSVPTTSLSDIAFLLLVFFLITTTIDLDQGLGLILPAEHTLRSVADDNFVACLINSTGNVLLGDQVVMVGELGARVQALRVKNQRLIVSVKTHPQVRYQDYITVLDQLRRVDTHFVIAGD